MANEVVRLQRFWPSAFTADGGIPKGVFMRYAAWWIETIHGLTTINLGDYVATYPDGQQDVRASGERAGLEIHQAKGKLT